MPQDFSQSTPSYIMLYHFELQMAGAILLTAMFVGGIYLWVKRRRERGMSSEDLRRDDFGTIPDDIVRHDDIEYDDTKHDGVKYDDTKHDDTKHDDTKHDDTKHDDTKHDSVKYDDTGHRD
ncbi:MAG: hypothetical protein OXC46_10365 [Thaumarchaeota archaeon]|nr:hypothetical protein [Nitrososphaerota archaeon]